MIISGGVNIYPQECENLLITHPQVADAAVFGVPNVEMGEEVKAVVQPMPGVAAVWTGGDLAAAYLNRGLAESGEGSEVRSKNDFRSALRSALEAAWADGYASGASDQRAKRNDLDSHANPYRGEQ